MKGKRYFIIFSILAVLFVFSFNTSNAGAASGDQVFKIGLMTSITGFFAPVTQPQYAAIKATEEILNERGGITVNGMKYNIKIIAQDDQSSPTGAVTAFAKLSQDDIKFMVSSMFPPANLAIAKNAEQNKVIRIMAVGLGNIQLNSNTRYNFFASATTYNIKPAYDYFVKKYPDKKRIALVLPDNPETDFVMSNLKKVIDNHNLPIAFKDVYAEGTQDFNPIVTKAMAGNPDAIDLGFCIPPWEKAIITGARDLGFKGPIFGSLLLGDPHVLNSMISPNHAYDIFSTGSVDVNSPKMPAMVNELGKKLKRDNTIFNMDSTTLLEAIYPLLQAIEKAQSFDPDKVVATFENMKNIDTLYGPGVIGGQDTFGINHVVIRAGTLSRIVNGKIEFEYIEQ